MSALGDRLRARIQRDGPITFAEYMEAALYDADGGYYAGGPKLGHGGQFATAPTVLPLFGQALAAELRALWERLGRPRPFTLVEVGPGDGSLMVQLERELAALPIELVLCDRAAGMLARARERVPTAAVASLDELGRVVGAIVANEVHDACPAHRLRWPDELRVGLDADGRFIAVAAPPADPRLEELLRAAGVEPVEGAAYEVAPAQAELQTVLARALARGVLYIFDYGEAGPLRYTRPIPRLRTHIAGMPGGDVLQAPGAQDITADVDFGAVRAAGEAEGLVTVLDEPQPDWLRRHGADAVRLSAPPGSEERLWLETFGTDEGSGSTFHALVQETSGLPA